jgi:hypothetical protein
MEDIPALIDIVDFHSTDETFKKMALKNIVENY